MRLKNQESKSTSSSFPSKELVKTESSKGQLAVPMTAFPLHAIVGRVHSVKLHDTNDKAYILQIAVDLQGRTLQVVSSIAKDYKKEELVGKSIIVVTNLKPIKIQQVNSQGLVLLVTTTNDSLSFLTSTKPVGTQVTASGVENNPVKVFDVKKEFERLQLTTGPGGTIRYGSHTVVAGDEVIKVDRPTASNIAIKF